MTQALLTELEKWPDNLISLNKDWVNSESIKSIEDSFLADYRRYYPQGEFDPSGIKYFPGLTATLFYRIARHYFNQGEEKMALDISTFSRYLTGIELYYSASIGGSLKINHGAGLVVGARVVIGRNALLHQNVTLGDRNGGRPVLGDNVVIYPGSLVLGNISVGNNVIIGANSLVHKNVPDDVTVVGNPFKILHGKN